MDQKKTGQFLKMLRNEKQMTQEQLAQVFNVSSRSVSRWETGSNLPDISLLVEIADFYDVDVREIIDGERKSEMMNNEVREVAEQMAAYAGKEKSKLLTFVQIVSIVGIVLLAASIVLQSIRFEYDAKNIATLVVSILGLGVMGVITLYVTGVLQKIVKNKKGFFTTVIIVVVALLIYALFRLFLICLAVGFLILSVWFEKIEVYDDIENYDNYFNTTIYDEGDYQQFHQLDEEMFRIYPETITSDMDPKDFLVVYYNPWDPQFVTDLVVDYTPADYAKEIARLKLIGVEEEYLDYYNVTGEPEGYDIIAMDADEYYGFVYAMIPEGAAADNTEITYVGIWFCNYFMDLDPGDYLPEEHILEGLDVSDNNPYALRRREELGIPSF